LIAHAIGVLLTALLIHSAILLRPLLLGLLLAAALELALLLLVLLLRALRPRGYRRQRKHNCHCDAFHGPSPLKVAAKSLWVLVGAIGLEPTTPTMSR
jgi:hypothetical protein